MDPLCCVLLFRVNELIKLLIVAHLEFVECSVRLFRVEGLLFIFVTLLFFVVLMN